MNSEIYIYPTQFIRVTALRSHELDLETYLHSGSPLGINKYRGMKEERTDIISIELRSKYSN